MTEQSKPQQSKRKTTEELILDFCQDLQKGDLGMNKLIKNGYLLYGQTRSGKTAASHLLSGNALKGVKIGGEEKVENTTSKNKNAKIGNTPVSQTRVPNLFEIKHPNKPEEKAYVIDTPGYGDTYGTYRLLGNGYYHYKLYSKVQNMKFILCFDQIQLQNTAQLFINTIIQFTSYFKDYEDHKEQIWNSCVFLINKVDEKTSLNDLNQKMREIQKSIKIQKKQKEINLIKQFINFILEQDRVFTIKKYRSGDSATRADLLKAIDQKCSWWSRKLNPKNQNEVDMEPILFNLTKPILVELTKQQISKEEFIKLMLYYNDKISQILSQYNQLKADSFSLDLIFLQLVKDAMGTPNSHDFLLPMKKFVDKYYHLYDPNYKDQREKLEKELFQSAKGSQSVNHSSIKKSNTNKDKNFIVKKFHVLEEVEKLKEKISDVTSQGNKQDEKKTQIQKNEQLKQVLEDVIRKFNQVSYKKKNCAEIIYKYGYIIHRVINQVQVLTMLMESGSAEKNEKLVGKNKIIDAAEGNFLSLLPLKSFMSLKYKYEDKQFSYEELKEKFINNVDLNSKQFKQVKINWALVELFSKVEQGTEISQISQSRMEKIIILLEKFSEQFLSEKQTKQEDRKDTLKLISQLSTSRVNCSEMIKLTQNEERKDFFFFMNRRITNNIGKLLEGIKNYHLAREVYKSIMSVHSVCRLYEEEIKSLEKPEEDEKGNKVTPKENNKLLKLRIEYSNFCREHGRNQVAVLILQEAFELCSNKQELEEVKGLLSDTLLDSQKNDKTVYEQSLYANTLMEQFSQELACELICQQKVTITQFDTKE